MASLAFQVHTDKENATPGLPRSFDKSLQGKSVQAFPGKGINKLTQPTPRKALGSVNNQVPPVPQSHGLKGKASVLQQAPVNALFKSKKSVGDENLSAGHFVKKSKVKSSPVLHTGLKKPTAVVHASKPKVKSRPEVEPIPVIPDDVEYDSDTILPRNERLSCYVEKLFNWRPPCLFGTLPDSDSDNEEVVEEFPGIGDIDPPSFDLFDADDDQDLPQNLSDLLVDLPSLSPPHDEYNPVATGVFTPDFLPLSDQSLDTSLHLGQLQFGSMTPEPYATTETVADMCSDSHNVDL